MSEAAVEIYGQHGVRWLVTDEGILERSLGRSLRADHDPPVELYRGWRLAEASPTLFFRDRSISDRIGFELGQWPNEAEAAADMVRHLVEIAGRLDDDAAIVIALDGENPWPHYPDAGGTFLREMMRGINDAAPALEPVTLSELSRRTHAAELSRLHPGSWIHSIFATWIGHPEKTAAWELLTTIRNAIDGAQPPPSMLLAVPLFHVNGLHVQLLQSFRQGRKLVGMYKWDVEEALRLIEAERITALQGVPTMAWEVIRSPHLHDYDTSSLAYVGGGGAAMAPEHARRIGEHLGRGVPGTGYGMTETNALGTTVAGKALLSRPRTCGRPAAPLVSIKVVDERGDEVPRGQSGEIWIHGAMNFRGYWNNPEATREALSDGWVHTGDIGHMDDEGYVFITDREKDMVIRGGENIGCQEVEAVLYDHPGVSECAVFGVPDERLGETLAAVIMPKPGAEIDADGVRAHVAAHLARFKVPEQVWLQREPLPRLPSGKIYKRALREQAIRALTETA